MKAKTISVLIFVSLSIAIVASFFASSHPDGLEWVAEKLGFLERASDTPGIMPDYSCPFITNATASTIAAGIAGALLVFLFFWLISRVSHNISKRRMLKLKAPRRKEGKT